MTEREIALRKLKAAKEWQADQERAHVEADDAICELLRRLGYDDVVDLYETIDKWYA